MLKRSYLRGFDADTYDLPGIYGIPHARVPGSWRIVASYTDGRRSKQRLFTALQGAGQREARGSWDWHHVVEGQHYADVAFTGRFRFAYEHELPCVLVSQEEHRAYNRLLHIDETDELFRDTTLPTRLEPRAAAADAQARDRVLQAIADNVLADTLLGLR